MKHIALALIIIAALMVGGCSSSSNESVTNTQKSDKSTPDNSVRGYYAALNAGNMDEWCTYWYEVDDCFRDNRNYEEETKNATISFSDVDAKTIHILGVEALVEVNYKYHRESPRLTLNIDGNKIVELEKFGDEWLMWGIEDKKESTEYYIDRAVNKEFAYIQTMVEVMMMLPEIPIENLNTDPRIASFVGDPSNPTNNMADGGLITLAPEHFVNGGTVHPVSSRLAHDITGLYYIVDAEGNVRAFYDENGENEVE